MPSDMDTARKFSRLIGCAGAVGVVVAFGIGGAYVDYRLVWSARAYCDAGFDAGGRFELNFHLLTRLGLMPVVTCVAAALGVLPHKLFSRAGTAGRVVGVTLGVAVAVAGPIGLVLYDFAVTGTIAGYPGDSGLCGPDNVPAWWPGWLPS
ncbi:hypothetical protein [Actinophytocola sp. KF-1]